MPCNLHPVFGVHVSEKFLEGCVIRIAYLPSFRRSSAGTTKSASGDEDEGEKELEHRLPRHHGHHDHHQPDHHVFDGQICSLPVSAAAQLVRDHRLVRK